jgi:integrase
MIRANLGKDLERINQALRQAGIRISIRQRGQKLYLRATLPPKPTSGKITPYQQEIAVNVGVTKEGLNFALSEAKRLGALLDSHSFSWGQWGGKPQADPMAEAIAKFEAHYFATRQRNIKTEETFRREYLTIFKRLEKLSESAMVALVNAQPPQTRTRKRYADSLSALAKFLGWDSGKIRALGKGYNRSQLNPRTIPTDAEIVKSCEIIPEELEWGFWIYAAYGLRPHEIYLADLTDFPMLRIGAGKTDGRVVFPFPPEWAERIGEGSPLPTTSTTNSNRGLRMSRAFHQHLPYCLYDLRHAWAIRTISYGLDISLAAQQMGHSVKVHSEIYHHWISEDIHRKAWERLTQSKFTDN